MDDSEIHKVHLDGSVLLKIIKHCEEEAMAGQQQVTGTLYGLAKKNCLEITYCLPSLPLPDTTNITGEDLNMITSQHILANQQFETEMVTHMRQVNIDYLNVGYYASAPGGCYLNRENLEGLFCHQNIMPESVMLIYDPTKVSRGQIDIKAFRLNQEMREVLREVLKEEEKVHKDHDSNLIESEAFRRMKLRYEELFVEVPTTIRNSHLTNVLLADLENRINRSSGIGSVASRYAGLNLSVASGMERQLKDILSNLEDLQMDISKHIHAQRLQNKNIDQSRMADGKHPQVPSRIDSALLAAQIDHFCIECQSLSEQSLQKLKITKVIQEGKASHTQPISTASGYIE